MDLEFMVSMALCSLLCTSTRNAFCLFAFLSPPWFLLWGWRVWVQQSFWEFSCHCQADMAEALGIVVQGCRKGFGAGLTAVEKNTPRADLPTLHRPRAFYMISQKGFILETVMVIKKLTH